ncbi:MAG: tRNA pseudouridine(55) synthase TruB [Alphaproteobacteria bacterium]|nr:tRNA pseudouridine(55) synthase TruB [Alphaproteobacteria bacterium]
MTRHDGSAPGQFKRKKLKIDGWVILDKPLTVPSTKAVNIIRRCFGAAKAGHSGTLDPLATGILPIALGEATKTIPYVMDASKDYAFTVKWGEETTTDDREGEVTIRHDHRPSLDEVNAILDQFRGPISQVPPIYSAIKKDGKRAYDMARNNEEVQLDARQVEIHQLNCLSCDDHEASFQVTTGKGAYIRSLGRDMARALGTAGHIVQLRRLRVGPFSLDKSISLDFFEEIDNSADAFKALHPVMTALDDIPALAITEEDALRLRRGQKIELKAGMTSPKADPDADDVVMTAVHQGQLVALITVNGPTASPIRVFNLST